MLPTVLGYLIAALVYLSLLQFSLSRRQKRFWLSLIVISAVIEASLALLQMFVFDSNNWMEFPVGRSRAYGNFQQSNLLGSFLATGFGIALYLLLTTRRQWVVIANGLTLMLLLATLVPLQSRIGWTGALVTSLLLLFHFRRHRKLRYILLIGLPLLLLPIATWLSITHFLPHSAPEAFTLVDKSGSNTLRWQMLQHSLHMIAEHPLKGWGMGGFEFSFTQHVLGDSPAGPLAGRAPTHPHNELLYLWIEGGIVALMGAVLLVIAWLRLVVSRNRLRRHRAFPLWCLTLPIALHTLFEYPLYQSAAHGLVLLMLIRLTLAESSLKTITRAPKLQIIGRCTVAAIATIIIVFALTGLRTNAVLTQTERSGFSNSDAMQQLINPYAQWERYIYDSHMLELKRFNETKDYHYLEEFKIWADNYIMVHHDANIYFTLIRIADVQQSHIRKAQLIQHARQLFPDDVRFAANSFVGKS